MRPALDLASAYHALDRKRASLLGDDRALTFGMPIAIEIAAVCPAWRRTRDKLPAGSLILEGPFVAAHGTELIRIAHNEAEHERLEHPLNRIMQIDEHEGRIEISTTDIHLPQRIGEALKRAHHGKLTMQYGKDAYSVRLHWQR